MPFQDNLVLTYLAGCVGATLLELVTGLTQTEIGTSVFTNVLFSVVIAGGGAVLLYHGIEKKFEH